MVLVSYQVAHAANVSALSPDGSVMVTVGVKSDKPFYNVKYHGALLVDDSRLGFLLDDGEVGAHVKMVSKRQTSKDETWRQVWGEEEGVRNH